MKDVLDELAAARRKMGTATLPAGEAYTMELRRRYDAHLDDVWDAITSPERLSRWLKPVTGDLRPGAGGVGWDLHLLALARFPGDGEVLDHEEFPTSPAGHEFSRRSAAAWGEAHLAGGGEPDHVAAAVEATTAFYLPTGDASARASGSTLN